MKKKICVVTGSRADYGLLSPLLRKIKHDDFFELQVVATGMHLSPEFGLTYSEIIKDNFKIRAKVEMLLSSDTEVGIAKSIGIGIGSFADTSNRLKPDLIILLGDRFEIFAAAVSAFVANIPIAHIHGGELTEGAVDDAFRHSITKMSLLHFASTEDHRKRIIQLGEEPSRVFNVGALGIDNIKTLKLLKKGIIEKEVGFKFDSNTILVTLHPTTLENNSARKQCKELLRALDIQKNLKIIFTKPNADAQGAVIAKLIDEYVAINSSRVVGFVSLGNLKYLSVIQYVAAVVGNSSSGIIEVPTFGKPTINVGNRQKGRVKAKSIIDCGFNKESITAAFKKAFSPEFIKFCRNVKNPYGDGKTADKIYKILKRKIKNMSNIKKRFYDL